MQRLRLCDELQQTAFRAGDADDQAPVLVSMLAAQRDRSLTVDQPGDVRGIRRMEHANRTIAIHELSIGKPSGNNRQKNAARSLERRVMVEAAGQLIHLFRDGLDYAFILQTQDAGRVIRDRNFRES